MVELLVVLAIIGVVLAVTIPSMTTLSRDLETNKARSDVFASLTAARSRAIASHNLVALHIFRDTAPVYSVPAGSTDPTQAAFSQSDPTQANWLRWGVQFNPTTGLPAAGMPHVPTNQLTMRLEIPNPDSLHNQSATPTGPNGLIPLEFFWPADHDPIILPPNVAICQPAMQQNVNLTQTEVAGATGQVDCANDFYIVFAEDGKVVTISVDYNLAYALANPTNNVAAPAWSASGLCLFDPKAAAAAPNWMTYVDQNAITISGYTGLPLEGPSQ
jgi:type II secretory pathway pseudopilin PulG